MKTIKREEYEENIFSNILEVTQEDDDSKMMFI